MLPFLAAALLLSFQRVVAEGRLSPPRHFRLVSKDFSLFLTWLPDEHYPPGVSYTVEWKSAFITPWRDIPHCRNISETMCNVTCVSPELNNRYQVQVRAQNNAGILPSIEKRKVVDYEVDVDVAPPILQLRRTKDILGVNVTFAYPSCAEKIFQQDLSYDLKFWDKHGTEKPREFKGLTKNAIDIDVKDWTSGNYCVLARAFFSKNKKQSNFSEPICTLLHEKSSTTLQGAQNWGFVVFPLLILISAGPVSFFMWYKSIMRKIKMPQALDFSRFRSMKNLLDLSGGEFIPVHTFTCTEVPLISGWRIRPALRVSPSPHSMLEEDEEEEDEEDDDGPILYTKRLQFQKKESNCQNVATIQKVLGSSSGKSELSGEGHLPDGTVSGNPWVANGDNTSGFSKSNSLSEHSSAESSLGFPVAHFASLKEGQESGDIDILFQWSGLQFGDIKDRPEFTCGRAEDAWVNLDEIRDNPDSFEIGFVKDSSRCDGLSVETSLSEAPCCKEDLENELLEGNGDVGVTVLSSSKFLSYRPKLIPYISRT